MSLRAAIAIPVDVALATMASRCLLATVGATRSSIPRYSGPPTSPYECRQ